MQLVNAYPKRRFEGSVKSCQQSPHVPTSAGTSDNSPSRERLFRIENSVSPFGSISKNDYLGDLRKRRRIVLERVKKAFDLVRIPLEFDRHSCRRVQCVAREREFPGEIVDERAEADSLHYSRDLDSSSNESSRGLGGYRHMRSEFSGS